MEKWGNMIFFLGTWRVLFTISGMNWTTKLWRKARTIWMFYKLGEITATLHMEVSWNGGTAKLSMVNHFHRIFHEINQPAIAGNPNIQLFIGLSIVNHPLVASHFRKPPYILVTAPMGCCPPQNHAVTAAPWLSGSSRPTTHEKQQLLVIQSWESLVLWHAFYALMFLLLTQHVQFHVQSICGQPKLLLFKPQLQLRTAAISGGKVGGDDLRGAGLGGDLWWGTYIST